MQGYELDNPNIQLLRLRNYTIKADLSDDEIVGPKGIKRIAELMGVMEPFITYLNSVVMPDGTEATSDEEEEEEEEENGEE